MSTRNSSVSFLAIGLLAILTIANAQTRPPVILVDGCGYTCATAPRTSAYSFGQLKQKLAAQGFTVVFFRPCDVPPDRRR